MWVSPQRFSFSFVFLLHPADHLPDSAGKFIRRFKTGIIFQTRYIRAQVHHRLYTPLEAGNLLFTDASKFYSSYISSAQRLPNGNTLITEGSDGHLIEVTPEHEIVWEYVNPYFKNIGGNFKMNMVYRAYRTPYEWVPQATHAEEVSIEPLDVETFRVPGASKGAGTGKVTVVAGVDPNRSSVTGMNGDDEDSDEERLDFCVASVKKGDLKEE